MATTTIRIPNGELVPAATTLRILTQYWLEPGKLAYEFSQLFRCLRPLVEAFQEQDEALIDKWAEFEGEGEARKRKVEEIKQGDQVVAHRISMTNSVKYGKAKKELDGGTTEVTLPFLIQSSHLERIEKERIPRSKIPEGVPVPDMAALMCLTKEYADRVTDEEEPDTTKPQLVGAKSKHSKK